MLVASLSVRDVQQQARCSSLSSSQLPLATNSLSVRDVRRVWTAYLIISSRSIEFHALLRLKRCHARDPMACLSGVHSLTGCHCKRCHHTTEGKEPLFIQPSDLTALNELLAANTPLKAADYILPGTEADFGK